MKKHAPPPTKFGNPAPAQAKSSAPGHPPITHAPPPTRYGANTPVQAKPDTRTPGAVHHPPSTKFAPVSPAQPYRPHNQSISRPPQPACGCCFPHRPATVQRMESLIENESSSIGVVGSNLTAKEVTGGNIQTTSLRVKINGKFIGKFNNVTRAMAQNDQQAAKQALINMGKLGYSTTGKKKPHAEDYMILFFHDNAQKGAFKKSDLVSIAMDKSPCIVCAQNLVKFSNYFGFSLRIKAGLHFEATKKRGVIPGKTGTQYLEENKIPIRAWPLASIADKLKGDISDIKEDILGRYKTSFRKFNVSSQVIGTGDDYKSVKIGWKSVGYSRSQSGHKLYGRNWPQ